MSAPGFGIQRTCGECSELDLEQPPIVAEIDPDTAAPIAMPFVFAPPGVLVVGFSPFPIIEMNVKLQLWLIAGAFLDVLAITLGVANDIGRRSRSGQRQCARSKYSDGSYDNANINTLQAALNLACDELGISQDREKCEAMALLILGYARAGQTDVNKLKSDAVERFECSLSRPVLSG
jgi:hypothetical protein